MSVSAFKSLTSWNDYVSCFEAGSAKGCAWSIADGVMTLTVAGKAAGLIRDARLLAAADPNAVIGKVKDLGSVGDSEYTLLDKLPDQGSPKANWQQNSGVLREEMSRGVPIRDASVDSATGERLDNTGFLRAERNLLQTKGWTYDPKTTLWSPGG